MKPIALYPVFSAESNSSVFFEHVADPIQVTYSADDPYRRQTHQSQFLKVPVDVPNYLALCAVPKQVPWKLMDELDANSLCVQRIAVSLLHWGRKEVGFIETHAMAANGFFPSPERFTDKFNLHMRIRDFGGFSLTDLDGNKVGETIFAGEQKAGWEPLFDLSLIGTFNRQLNRLTLRSTCKGITAIRNIKTGEIIKHGDTAIIPEGIFQSVSNVEIFAAQLRQDLK